MKEYTKYIALIIALVICFLGFLILKPIITPLILSFFIAYAAYPLYRKINIYIKNESIASLIVSILILLIITVPIILTVNILLSQTQVVYTVSRQIIITGNPFYADCTDADNLICRLIAPFSNLIEDPKVKYYLDDGLNQMTNTVIEKTTDFIFAIPMRILDFFIMLFTIYYLFKDGPKLVKRIKRALPIAKETRNLLFCRIKEVFYAMIYGYFLVALIQGILGGIGFFAVGLSSPVFWGLVMAFAALLPIGGTGLVWLPASLFMIANGMLENDNTGIYKGIALLLWGALIVSTIDNILRPKIVSSKANIHPVVVLIGLVGGIAVFGFIGIFLGPMILMVLITMFSIYEKVFEKSEDDDDEIYCEPRIKKRSIWRFRRNRPVKEQATEE